jgi:hypothetical protein
MSLEVAKTSQNAVRRFGFRASTTLCHRSAGFSGSGVNQVNLLKMNRMAILISHFSWGPMKSDFNVRVPLPLLAVAGVILGVSVTSPFSSALAAEDIGIAVTVRNEVTGNLQSQIVKITGGSNVFGKEVVKTNVDSNAKIVLKDSTNLSVGPNSSVTLDSFVFQGNSDYKQAGFNLAKGAFRFTSGGSDKRAYELKTPTATIGVRGTDFSSSVGEKIIYEKGKKRVVQNTHIEVKEGRVLVCPRAREVDPQVSDKVALRRGCVFVNEGEAVDVGENSVSRSTLDGQAAESACGGACGAPTSYAEAEQTSVGSNSVPIEGMGAGGGGGGSSAGAGVGPTPVGPAPPTTPN